MSSVTKRRTPRSLFARTRTAGGLAALAFAGLFMGACKDSGPRTIDSITVAPTTTTLAIGGTQQFAMTATDNDGKVYTDRQPVWAVVAGGGTITQTGLFTAGTVAGTFTNTVSVTCSGRTVFATVIITAGPLLTITVTPNPGTMPINTSLQYTAVGRDAGGNVVTITPVWSVVNGGGSIVAGTGLFTAGGATGTFTNTVRATSGTIFGSATAIVTSPPGPITTFGTGSNYGILAGSTITCAGDAVTPGTVNAYVGLSPGSALTGFPPCIIAGQTHLADAAAAQAQLDLTAAYNTLVGLPCGTVIGTADIGGTVRAPGVYCSPSTIGVTGALTLDGQGDPNATFVFQAGSSLTGVGTIVLINGALAKNVYWVNGASATIGVGSSWRGNIVAFTTITLGNNVTLLGRALARNGAVTLGIGSTITLP